MGGGIRGWLEMNMTKIHDVLENVMIPVVLYPEYVLIKTGGRGWQDGSKGQSLEPTCEMRKLTPASCYVMRHTMMCTPTHIHTYAPNVISLIVLKVRPRRQVRLWRGALKLGVNSTSSGPRLLPSHQGVSRLPLHHGASMTQRSKVSGPSSHEAIN